MRRALAPVALALVIAAAHGYTYDVGYDPFVPTPHAIVEQMLALAEVGPNDLVVDLGSGDGRIVIAAAKQFGSRALGVDIDRTLVAEAAAPLRIGVATLAGGLVYAAAIRLLAPELWRHALSLGLGILRGSRRPAAPPA